MNLDAKELTVQLSLARSNLALAEALESRARDADQRKTVARLAAGARKAAAFYEGALTGLAAAA